MGVYDCDNYNDLMARLDEKRVVTSISPTQMSGTSDTISRQAAIELWERYRPYIAVKACEYDSELRNLPSAQPERKPGKWEIYVISMFDGEGCRCSECGFEGAPYWDFCPGCGANMEEVKVINDE